MEGKSTVELQPIYEPVSEEQKWQREKVQGSWFTLKNIKTEKYLTAFNQNTLIMKGNIVFSSLNLFQLKTFIE